MYGAQGESYDCAIADLGVPPGQDIHLYWLAMYVMLTRCKSLDGILLLRLPSRQAFEAGAPEYIKHEIKRLAGLHTKTMQRLQRNLTEKLGALPKNVNELFVDADADSTLADLEAAQDVLRKEIEARQLAAGFQAGRRLRRKTSNLTPTKTPPRRSLLKRESSAASPPRVRPAPSTPASPASLKPTRSSSDVMPTAEPASPRRGPIKRNSSAASLPDIPSPTSGSCPELPRGVRSQPNRHDLRSSFHSSLSDDRLRPTKRDGNQCFINATFSALSSSWHVQMALQRILVEGPGNCLISPGYECSSASAWDNLRRVAFRVAPALDTTLRLVEDQNHGSAEQRWAITFEAARAKPNNVPFVPRLLWHSYYNYDPLPEQKTQEDVCEFLQKLLTNDDSLPAAKRSPLLCSVVERTIQSQFVCQELACGAMHSLTALDYGTLITVSLGGEAFTHGGQPFQIDSVQCALDMYFQGSLATHPDVSVLSYNGEPWRCRQCGSSRLPHQTHTMLSFPKCLLLQLKRWQSRAHVEAMSQQVLVDETLVVQGVSYSLRSVVRHFGEYHEGGGSGHYVANCRFPGSDKRWWHYDDSRRLEMQAQHGSDAIFKSYLLVYDCDQEM